MSAYIQILEHIEREILELSYHISFEEKQKRVYSPKIADLIIRLGGLLESVIKDEYRSRVGEIGRVSYDDDEVIKKLNLENKKVYLTMENCDFTKKEYKPFIKDQERLNKQMTNFHKRGETNYCWNNAYQSLRHQFIQMIPEYGTLEYLFAILSAVSAILNNKGEIFSTLEGDTYWKKGGNISIRKRVKQD